MAIFIPIIIFFIVLTVAYYTGFTIYSEEVTIFGESTFLPTRTYNPFDWEKTWYVWMLYLIFCCIFEYKLFGDKKKKQ